MLRLPSADSSHVLIEVVDPDEKISARSGRIGLAVLAPDHGHGWVSVYDSAHREVGQAYVEFKKKKKNKPDVPIAPAVTPPDLTFSVTPVGSGLGLRVSDEGVVLGYNAPAGPAQAAGVPIGAQILGINDTPVTSKSQIYDQLQGLATSSTVEIECAVPTLGPLADDTAAGEYADPSSFSVSLGSYYVFDDELKALDQLKGVFSDRVDVVVLEASDVTEDAAATSVRLMANTFHAAVVSSIISRWGPRGRHPLEATQLGALLSWVKDYLDFMARFGWEPPAEFVEVLTNELFGPTAVRFSIDFQRFFDSVSTDFRLICVYMGPSWRHRRRYARRWA